MDPGAQTITITSSAWDTLARHAASAFPEECCGVLIGLAAPQPQHEPRLQGAVNSPRPILFNREHRERVAGFTSTSAWSVHSAQPCINRAPHSRNTRFLIDPEDLLDARQRAREAGIDLIGFYHSHPGKTAYFSERDLRECWPGFPSVVIPVIDGVPGLPRAFLANRDQSRAFELRLIIAA